MQNFAYHEPITTTNFYDKYLLWNIESSRLLWNQILQALGSLNICRSLFALPYIQDITISLYNESQQHSCIWQIKTCVLWVYSKLQCFSQITCEKPHISVYELLLHIYFTTGLGTRLSSFSSLSRFIFVELHFSWFIVQ